MNKNGEMKWRTCFSSISFAGYKLDVLKSALQKYLRRREEEKMLWCLGEIYLFKALATTDKERKAAKGIISNMLNRLIIMMDEEMLFAEVGKYMKCMEWIKEFDEGGRDNFKLLVKVCKTMLGARMLRLNSDIYSYWWRGAGVYKVVKVPGLGMEEALYTPIEVHKECKEILRDEDGTCWGYEYENLLMFIAAFRAGHSSCYYWALAMFHCDKKGSRRFFRRTDSVYIIWEYLFKVAGDNEKLQKCLELKLEQFFVKTRHEQHIWLSSAISILLHKDKLDFEEDWDIDVGDEEVLEIFRDRTSLKIDDYAIDMHCSAGRKMGKKKADFALEGCVVVGEDKEYYNRDWRELYCDLKINPAKYGIVDNGKRPRPKSKKKKKEKKKNDVDDLVEGIAEMKLESNMRFIDGSEIKEGQIKICMNKTCGNKVMCFEHNGQIWKESRASFGYNKDYELVDSCKEIFGLKKIGMERIQSNFRIEKIDKKKSDWSGNWRKVMTSDEKVVYCLMRKIGDGGNFSENKDKKKLLENQEVLKEIAKIAMFRGIFRVTDFNLRNILIDNDGSLISIDEGDIGKRKNIFGGKEKWLKKHLTSAIITEAYSDMWSDHWGKKADICKQMKKFGYSEKTIDEVELKYDNLDDDLKSEGYM
tara:strand:- start:214 stop:2145 length:1932 start_codon:yes stop_codon:yes gene_type:complete